MMTNEIAIFTNAIVPQRHLTTRISQMYSLLLKIPGGLMKKRLSIFLFLLLTTAAAAFGQTSWLDRPLNSWNNGNGTHSFCSANPEIVVRIKTGGGAC